MENFVLEPNCVFLFSKVELWSLVCLSVTFVLFVCCFFLEDVRYLSYGYMFEATEQVNVFGLYSALFALRFGGEKKGRTRNTLRGCQSSRPTYHISMFTAQTCHCCPVRW